MNEKPPTKSEPQHKKPYEPPSIQKVALRPEEAVLGFCKNNTVAGPGGGTCRAVGVCASQGS